MPILMWENVKSPFQSKQNSLNWNSSNESVRVDNLHVWNKNITKNQNRSSLILVCHPFLSHQALLRHCVREGAGSMWKHHLLAFTSQFFCLGSLSLTLYKEVMFQKYFCAANLTISSWLGFEALGHAHSLAPAGTSSVMVVWLSISRQIYFFRERQECDPLARGSSVPREGNPILCVKVQWIR